MHYNISLGVAKNLIFFIKKNYSMQGWDVDGVQFLIPVEYWVG